MRTWERDMKVYPPSAIALGLVLIMACASMERSLVQPELWSNPDEGVNVTRAGVRIGSSTLELPTTEARLIEILGQPDRRSTLQNTILVWDHLGMFAYETPGTESIDSIAVSFTCRDV